MRHQVVPETLGDEQRDLSAGDTGYEIYELNLCF